VIPVEMREGEHDLLLLVPHQLQVPPQFANARARVNDGDLIDVGERDLEAGGVSSELLKTCVTHGNGTSDSVEFQFHAWHMIGDCEWLDSLKNALITLDARDANSVIPAQVNENWFVDSFIFHYSRWSLHQPGAGVNPNLMAANKP
jgi:hypothetical protein